MFFFTLFCFLFFISTMNLILLWFFFTIVSMMMVMNIFNMESKIKYFVVQEMSMMIFLVLLFYEKKFLILLPLMMKMGVPPFFNWMLEIFVKSIKFETIYFITFIKIFPCMLIISIINFFQFFFFFFLFIFLQIFPFFFKTSIKVIVFFSSNINFFVVFFLSMFNFLFFSWAYLMFYLILTYWSTPSNENLMFKNVNYLFLKNTIGIPPSPMFFLKSFSFIILMKYNFIMFFLLFFSIIFYYIYVLLFFKIFNIEKTHLEFKNLMSIWFNSFLWMFFVFFLLI